MTTQVETIARENRIAPEEPQSEQLFGHFPEKLDRILPLECVNTCTALEQLYDIILHIEAREQNIDPHVAASYRYIQTALVQKTALPF